MSTVLQIKSVPIDSLEGAEWNPRHMSERAMEKLIASLDRFGFVQPVIVNTRTGLVVGGHQRIEAARRLEYEDIPIIEVDLSEKEAKTLNLALNRISGQWDPEALADILTELTDDDVVLAGFDSRELGDLEDVYFQRRIGREADPVAPPTDTEAEIGDIWTLGKHTLVCGDARVPESYEAFTTKATGLITDPPYGVNYQAEDGRFFHGDDAAGIGDLVKGMLKAARPHLTDRAGFYLFCPTGPAMIDHLLAVHDSEGYVHRQTLVWVKNQASLTIGIGAHYKYQHEAIIDGEKEDDDEERTMASTEILYGATGTNPYFAAGRGETTAMLYDRPREQKLHPTEKPGPLLERLIRNSTRRGDHILDPFAGSGSIMVAAENRLRATQMIEVEPAFCDVIVTRYRELTGKKGRKRHDAELAAAIEKRYAEARTTAERPPEATSNEDPQDG